MENFVERVEHEGTEEVVEVHQILSRIESREYSDCSTDLLHTQIANNNNRTSNFDPIYFSEELA